LSCLTIRVVINHTSIDPAEITAALAIEPSKTRRVAYRGEGSDGEPGLLKGEILWSLWRDYYVEEPDISKLVLEFLQPFVAHAAFISTLMASEGRGFISLMFPGNYISAAR
jgi:hypothetical protein